MIRILQVLGAMEYGGMESFVMNLYRQMDRSKIQFDFLTHHGRRGAFEDEIEAMGGKVYHTTVTDDGNMIRYLRALKALYAEHPEYRIVHGHLGSMAYWYLGEAEKQGVPWRILHSHVSSYVPSLKGYVKDFLFRFSPRHANIRMACSEEAGVYQFKDQPFEVISNGIDVEHFRFQPETRNKIRQELGLESRFVIGHVGRFFPEKNHAYLIRVFSALKKQMPDAALVLIGIGYLQESVMTMVRELGLEKDVLFLGLQKDPAPYYQAMDVFVLPSLYEGLPLTGVEAQSAGLPCLFTDKVSSRILLRPDAGMLPVQECDIGRWVRSLSDLRETEHNRDEVPPALWNYDIRTVAGKMASEYMSLLERQS